MYGHKGVTTNNNAKSFHSKLGSKAHIKAHPNPHILVDEIKVQLEQSRDTQMTVSSKAQNKKQSRKT